MKSPVLLDTNVASFLYGRKPEAALYAGDARDRQLMLSFQTVGEMLYGGHLKNWGQKKRADLAASIQKHGVIYPDADMIVTWASMRAELHRLGKTLYPPDTWIAATALATDLPLLAHDAAFRFVPGLKLICRAPDCPPPTGP